MSAITAILLGPLVAAIIGLVIGVAAVCGYIVAGCALAAWHLALRWLSEEGEVE